jgi:hypothetical protein
MTTPAKPSTPAAAPKPSDQEVLEYKRRLFETADRSYVNDRLIVNLPEHLHGEWLGVDDFSQFHAQAKGYVDGSEYLEGHNKLHDRPDGSTIGDVKFMVIPKWKHEAQLEQAALMSERQSGINSDAANERYQAYASQLGLGVERESSTGRRISGSELQAHLPR